MNDPQETTTSTPDKNDNALLVADDVSPNTMVKEAVANAMRQQQEQRKTQREEQEEKKEEEADDEEEETVVSASKRIKLATADDRDDSLKQLEELWSKEKVNDDEKRREATKCTRDLLENAINDMIQDGVRAHHEWARTHQQLQMAQEDILAKTREIERLRSTDQKNRESISVRSISIFLRRFQTVSMISLLSLSSFCRISCARWILPMRRRRTNAKPSSWKLVCEPTCSTWRRHETR
jgi:hypothetical protein